MEIYIEYALIENFLFDVTLLYLATKAARATTSLLRLIFSAIFGAVFALLFPLLYLPKILGFVLKLSVGFLLCLLAVKGIKTKKDRGRYALTCLFFFIFSFSFGGILLALTRDFFWGKVPSLLIIICFSLLTVFSCYLIKKLYAKKSVSAYVYECKISFKNRNLDVLGFWDSGNLARKNFLPVCFLTPELFYDLFEEEIFSKEMGQVCDEMQIQTVNGLKNIPLYLGEIEMKGINGAVKKQVYFAPSKNIISREYSLLLPSSIFDEEITVIKNENENEKSA